MHSAEESSLTTRNQILSLTLTPQDLSLHLARYLSTSSKIESSSLYSIFDYDPLSYYSVASSITSS